MTPEEMKANSAKKVKEIKDLCKDLQVTLVPKQMITESGVIENVIFYQDNEAYPKKENVKDTDI